MTRLLFVAPEERTEDDADLLIDDTKLDKLTTWTAAGVTALTTVLTAFGLKEGALDQLLRNKPFESLFAFSLVGIGVIAALFAATLRPRKLRMAWVLVVGTVMSLTCGYVLDDLIASDPGCEDAWPVNLFIVAGCVDGPADVLTVVGGIAVVVLVVATWKVQISLPAGVLLLATIALALGLYSTAKLAVESKQFTDDTQLVSAELTTSDTGSAVTVALKVAGRDKDEHLVVELYGLRTAVEGSAGAEPQLLGRQTAQATAEGEVDASFPFPVVPSRWSGFSVRTCDAQPCDVADERVSLAGTRPTDALRAGGSLSRTADGATATFTASGVAETTTIEVWIGDLTARRRIANATLVPDSKGSVTWTVSPSLAPGAQHVLQLRYALCREPSCAPVTAALLVVPRQE